LIRAPRQQYFFQCETNPESFLQWAEGELRQIKWSIDKNSKTAELSRNIPAAYHRLVCQLNAEITHAEKHSGHEALRRCSYAMEVLDTFGEELASLRNPGVGFRSKVLTPILQRQLRGIPDHYSPSISCVIASDCETVTIRDATEFYLSVDPTDPQWISVYRRNLISVPEMRWHLGVVMGKIRLGDGHRYDDIRASHDVLMSKLQEEESDDEDPDTASPRMNAVEVQLIVDDGLEDYFAEELKASPVRTHTPLYK
jgi:hypothetical protein